MKRTPLKRSSRRMRRTRLRSVGATVRRRRQRYREPDWQGLVERIRARDRWCRYRLPGCTGEVETAGHLTYRGLADRSEGLEELAGTCHACNAYERWARVFGGQRAEMAKLEARLVKENRRGDP